MGDEGQVGICVFSFVIGCIGEYCVVCCIVVKVLVIMVDDDGCKIGGNVVGVGGNQFDIGCFCVVRVNVGVYGEIVE